jgi:hypothetical protein
MKKVFFMHGGSGNHGCEAIVRTSTELLGGPKDLVLWTGSKAEDCKYGVANLFENIVVSEELRRFSPAYFEAQIKKKLFGRQNAIKEVFIKHLFKDSIAVSIGGDNYCYPWSARDGANLDREIRKYCKKTVLWGCSVDGNEITPDIEEDLSQFDLITARETISYEYLKTINPNTILVADPAFLLRKKERPLPEKFIEGNTVGINVSPLIMQYTDEANVIMQNYETLIRYIIEETDMNICLIPHVVWEYNNDFGPIDQLYDMFKDSGRICKVEDGNAMELKGDISRCRFFVGARTHATIAAYSSCVPTLVVGYSVKAKGIALDLFGTDENYVLPVQDLRSKERLTDAFIWIQKQEMVIRQQLQAIMPEYTKQAWKAKDYLEEILK